MKTINYLIAMSFIIIMCSCSFNPIQPILVLTLKDFLFIGFFYILADVLLALYLSTNATKFWTWTIVGLIFLPIPIVVAIFTKIFSEKTKKV